MNIFRMSILGLASLTQFNPLSFAQTPADEFISTHGENLAIYQASLPDRSHCPEDFYHHNVNYTTAGKAQDIFDRLIALSPMQLWDGSIAFQRAYDPATQQSYDRKAALELSVTQGQVYFLNLNLPLGVTIPVSFQLVKVDPQQRIIEFSYVKQNKTQGIQFIDVTQEGDQARFTHQTCYRSGSLFRDRALYPWLHEYLLDEFYKNAFQLLSEPSQPQS